MDTDTDANRAKARELIEHAAAQRAIEAAGVLARYLEWKRPDLAESIYSIRGLGAAIRCTLPDTISPTPQPTFRHAVCLHDVHGRDWRRNRASEELAAELLVEYGTARGGVPDYWEVFAEDYGRRIVYVMEFVGTPTESTQPTRLQCPPRGGNTPLEGLAERYVVPMMPDEWS